MHRRVAALNRSVRPEQILREPTVASGAPLAPETPLAAAALAMMARNRPRSIPRSLTLPMRSLLCRESSSDTLRC